MERIYDIDISEIDFKGNQERMRKQLKKNKTKKVMFSILEAILIMVIGLAMVFLPAIIELIYWERRW